jgi:hypothetical protein
MRYHRLSVGAAALIGCLSALAVEPDQVRGQIVEIAAERNAVTVRVIEAGADRPEQVGDVQTYEFADPVAIHREPEGREILQSMAVGELGVTDLFAGDTLVIGFDDADGSATARQVTVSEGARPEDADIAPFEAEDEEQ